MPNRGFYCYSSFAKISGATFRIIGLTKIPKIEFLLLDWIYRSIRIITVFQITNRQWRGLMTGTELLSTFSNMTTTSPGMKPLSQPWRPPAGDRDSKKPSTSRTKKEMMNLDCGLTLSNIWLPSLELCRTSSWLNFSIFFLLNDDAFFFPWIYFSLSQQKHHSWAPTVVYSK